MVDSSDRNVYPEPLRPGDTIGIVAPASRPDPASLERGESLLRDKGFRVERAENLNRSSRFAAGDVDLRCRELVRMFEQPDINGVFCARGGKGTIHLTDRFLSTVDPSHPKPFVGYSDVTLLQMGLFSTRQWITFSGPMVATELGRDRLNNPALEQFWHSLTSAPDTWDLSFSQQELRVWQKGAATGPLLGGCLSMVQTLLGTPFMPDLEEALLVLEDVDEEPYRLDRMLHHLRLSGVLDQIGALVLGGFDTCFEQDSGEPSLREIVRDVLPSDRDLPVVAGLPYGHRLPSLRTLPLGVTTRLRTDPPALEFLPRS